MRLDDRSVSRVTVALVLDTSGLRLVDLLGREGTRLDGQTIRFGPVDVGSQLSVGVYSMSRMEAQVDPTEGCDRGYPQRLTCRRAQPRNRMSPPWTGWERCSLSNTIPVRW